MNVIVNVAEVILAPNNPHSTLYDSQYHYNWIAEFQSGDLDRTILLQAEVSSMTDHMNRASVYLFE